MTDNPWLVTTANSLKPSQIEGDETSKTMRCRNTYTAQPLIITIGISALQWTAFIVVFYEPAEGRAAAISLLFPVRRCLRVIILLKSLYLGSVGFTVQRVALKITNAVKYTTYSYRIIFTDALDRRDIR